MAEYIERKIVEDSAEYDIYHNLVVPIRKVRDVPAADVAPVVHGKWVVGGVHGNGVIGNWKCDICKGVSLKETLYCPYCGAKMDLEDK